jgi:NAD(P)-dependent dehydrogenase (short-subunit alcohol dehydrogenase family)
LAGAVHTAAEAIAAVGGRALPIVGDVRDDAQVFAAVELTAAIFGGIDIMVNNASAIDLSDTEALAMKRYDLMQDINCRGTFLLSKAALPHLRKSANAHPDPVPAAEPRPPLGRGPSGLHHRQVRHEPDHLGAGRGVQGAGIAVNSLWPRTMITTAAVANLLSGDASMSRSWRLEIMADVKPRRHHPQQTVRPIRPGLDAAEHGPQSAAGRTRRMQPDHSCPHANRRSATLLRFLGAVPVSCGGTPGGASGGGDESEAPQEAARVRPVRAALTG